MSKNKGFDVNNVVYSVDSDGEGGVIITYHQIMGKAEVTGIIKELVEGVMTDVRQQIPSINTDKMDSSNMFVPETDFCTLEDIHENVLLHINKRKYY